MYTPLEVIELSKVYNEREVVKNISFKINKNETIGILGPNGCGKTTTIGMLLGLIKPSNGKILINEQNFEDLKREKILSEFNFASPYVELPKKLTVKENLEMPLIYKKIKGSERKAMVADMLDRFNIVGKKDLFPAQLSGGQQQLVGIARALISNPKFL